MQPLDVITLLSQYGATAALVLLAWGGMTGRFLWRGSHDDIVKQYEERLGEWQQLYESMEHDRDRWRDQTMRVLNVAEQATAASKGASP